MIRFFLTLTLLATIFIAPTPSHAEKSFFQKLFPTTIEFPKDTITILTKEGRRFPFNVEVATTQKQLAKGLMGRKNLDENSGMLFNFQGPHKASFWMRNTLIPLDMIFITKDGVIDHIHSNARPLDETHITAPRPVWGVLEINGGQSNSWGIEKGDKILHPTFRNVLAQ